MREDEWLAWGDPREMLEFLRGAVDDRKLRLLGIGWVQTLPEYIDACYGVKTRDYGLYLQRGTRFPFRGRAARRVEPGEPRRSPPAWWAAFVLSGDIQ